MKESVANNISECSSARDSNNRLARDSKLHIAPWYEHFISSSGPYFVVSASTNALPDNLVLCNMQPSVEHHPGSLRLGKHSHLFYFFFPVSPLLAFLHRIRDCKSRQNVWRLCHIVKCVDVLLSTSLFTSTEQRLCVPRCFSASPFLLIPFLCTCSLNYLPRLLELSHPIIASSHRSLCSQCVLLRRRLISIRNKNLKKDLSKCVNYSTLPPIYVWCKCARVACLRVFTHTCNYFKRGK